MQCQQWCLSAWAGEGPLSQIFFWSEWVRHAPWQQSQQQTKAMMKRKGPDPCLSLPLRRLRQWAPP